MKKILVTGGHGFIGKHLATALASCGHAVTVCDVKKADEADLFLWDEVNRDVRIFMRELDTGLKLQSLFGEADHFDYIFHLAATPRLGMGLAFPEEVLRNNIDSLIDVLGYCRKNKHTKLIFISSSSVVWADCSLNPYAQSKAVGENILDTYVSTFGVNAVTARLFNVYGPGEAECGKNTTLVKQCKKAIIGKNGFTIFGDGSAVRDFTHVSDIVDGLLEIMSEMEQGVNANVYELGAGDDSVTVKQVVHAFFGDDDLITYADARFGEPPLTRADQSKWPLRWFPQIKVIDYINDWCKAGCPND